MVVPSGKKELVSLVMEDMCAKARSPDQMAGQGPFPEAESDRNAISEYYSGSSELRVEPAELRIETPEFISGAPERRTLSPERSHENLENMIGVETPESKTKVPEFSEDMSKSSSGNANYFVKLESPEVQTEILETKPPESVTEALPPDLRKRSPQLTRHSEGVARTQRVRTRTSGGRPKTPDCVLSLSSDDVGRTSEVPSLHTVLRTGVPLAEPEDEDQLLGEEVEDDGVAGGHKVEEHEHTRADTSGPGDSMEIKTKSWLEDTHCDIKDGFSEYVMEDGEEEEEELILGSNFADNAAAPPVETSFLPPLTMTTPLKCLAPPLPLLTSTPAVLGRTPFLLPYPLLSLPPSSSPPPSSPGPDGPLSLPGLVSPGGSKSYDYLLKVLLVGDSDCGKQEILAGMEDGAVDSPYASTTGAAYKTTIILIDGKRVKLQLWDTSGQGRFCTIIRSYSRGAQGILLVYDITNKWSFEGMDRWVKEVEEHAPGIPKVLVGNRLHLAFNRQVEQVEAERYAERHHMGFYEVSPLVNFNITESFQELCRMALRRNGMERLWRGRQVTSLHELCCHAIVGSTNVYGIDKLPLPDRIKANLKSYALSNATNTTVRAGTNYKSLKDAKKKRGARPADSVAAKCVSVSRKSCVIS